MGLEVMQAITLTAVPFLVSSFQLFLDLLRGDWGLDALDDQHDAMDFLCHFLLLTRPRFINGNWTSLLLWKQNMADTEMATECGHDSQPIRMQFPDFQALACDWKSLIEMARPLRLSPRACPGQRGTL